MTTLTGATAAYLVSLRDPAGAVRCAVVTASARTGPAGHRVYIDGDGGLEVEITCGGDHRVLRCAPGLRITSLAGLS
ncbi:DUF6296 family protein [Kitasatospora sp. NPDC002965]|uniref:DUF6296 family protein n=1 Tax=Kitasatospora sp. NPDC002965 TaxID=3154775 RepID=UPI0033A503CD